MTRHLTLGRLPGLTRILLTVTVLLTAIGTRAHGYTTANLLVDPSFEANPLLANYADVFAPPFTTGAWAAEVSTIVTGPDNGITPADGVRMLKMSDDGLVATQAWQLVDVTAYATDIDAALATLDASALYNVPQSLATGQSGLSVNFQNAAHGNLGTASMGSGLLDSNPGTWEQVNITSFAVPAGTRFMRVEVAFNNASMIDSTGASQPGYVDDTHLTLTVPEPATAMLAVGLAAPLLRRHRRA